MPHPPPIVFTDASLLEPATGERREGAWVAVSDGRISATGTGGVPTDRHGEVIDLQGRTLMPGLIDAHVHINAVTADLGAIAEWSPSYVAAKAAHALEAMLGRGFTTVRDVAGADYGCAAALEEGVLVGPRLKFGGKALSQTGGHGDVRPPGRHVLDDHPCCPSLEVICDGVAECRRAARHQLRTGADHIKIMLSGGVSSPTDRVDSTQFAADEIAAIVEEAEAAGRYVTGHAYTARAVNRGLELGVRCIEHGNLIDDRSVELFNARGAFLVPTLVTYQALASEGAEHGLPPESQAKVDDVLRHGLDALRRAHDGGVQLVFGTDLLGGMQRRQSEEFTIRAQVQPTIDVIRAATSTAAKLIGMHGQVGTVAPGAIADLIVVDGDPLADIRMLVEPDTHLPVIMTGGRCYRNRLTQAT